MNSFTAKPGNGNVACRVQVMNKVDILPFLRHNVRRLREASSVLELALMRRLRLNVDPEAVAADQALLAELRSLYREAMSAYMDEVNLRSALAIRSSGIEAVRLPAAAHCTSKTYTCGRCSRIYQLSHTY
ncbi:MAG: hypothetical protein EON54_18245 [Alcaligenaceae bacterium]|nr:MAG: hypothetical protein EON54_18245 [Alcaligenaceae bacterium]